MGNEMYNIERMESSRDNIENLLEKLPMNERYDKLRDEHKNTINIFNNSINAKILQFISGEVFDLIPEPLILCVYNIKSQKFIKVSKLLYVTLGYTEEEFYSKTLHELVDPSYVDVTEEARKYYSENEDSGSSSGFMNWYLSKDKKMTYQIYWYGTNKKVNHHYLMTVAEIKDFKLYKKKR